MIYLFLVSFILNIQNNNNIILDNNDNFSYLENYKFDEIFLDEKQYLPQKIIVSDKEIDCLAYVIYYEARNQSVKGRYAVADVVMNRVSKTDYPDNICDVVYQKYNNICQFTFACDGAMTKKINGELFNEAREISKLILYGYHYPITGYASHYHADYVEPVWSYVFLRTTKIGDHYFYNNEIKK